MGKKNEKRIVCRAMGAKKTHTQIHIETMKRKYEEKKRATEEKDVKIKTGGKTIPE